MTHPLSDPGNLASLSDKARLAVYAAQNTFGLINLQL